jgi:hypothetical protein
MIGYEALFTGLNRSSFQCLSMIGGSDLREKMEEDKTESGSEGRA